MIDEEIDILDERGERTGRIAPRSEAHRLGLWHRCFHCWIAGPETSSGGPYLFVQRRAADKDTWPNKLDVTVGGHLEAGEAPLDGLREVEEELGIRAASEDLRPLGTRRSQRRIPVGFDREFQDVFLLVRSLTPEDLSLDEKEVDAIVRLRLHDVEALYKEMEVEAEEWAGSGKRTISVRLASFVPEEDCYLLQVARAVRAILSDA